MAAGEGVTRHPERSPDSGGLQERIDGSQQRSLLSSGQAFDLLQTPQNFAARLLVVFPFVALG
jgi:hypothetical protein